jgi:spoIIIJ-associated protein
MSTTMASQREFEGKDLEETLQQASEALNVPEEELHYEIVEQGRRGVFGLGAKSVRIRVMPPLDAPARREAPAAEGPGRRKPRTPPPVPQASREPEPEPQRELQPGDETVRETVQRMVDLMGLELQVGATRTDGGLSLRLEGADQRALTARNGELQSAIAFLLNRMARRTWPDVGRIHLGEGRPRRRDDEIVALARQAAEQVSSTGKTKKLQPMNAYERRIVHLTVRDFPGLTSSSDGSGSVKRVRISKIQNAIGMDPCLARHRPK